MAEYAGALRGARLRRQNERQDRLDVAQNKQNKFNRAMRSKQHSLSQDTHTFNKNSRLRREKRNIKLDGRYNQEYADLKQSRSLQNKRLDSQDQRNETTHQRNMEINNTAKAERAARIKISSMSHDLIDDIAPFLLGKTKQLKNSRGHERNTNGLRIKDLRGNIQSYSPVELSLIVDSYSRRKQATLKTKQLQDKHNFKLQQSAQKQRLGMRQNIVKNKGYFFSALKNNGYDTSGFQDEEGEYTDEAKYFINSMQYFRNQGMDDQNAMDKAAMHIGLRRSENIQRNNTSTGQLSPEDMKFFRWAKQNPNDERSRKIIETLKKKYQSQSTHTQAGEQEPTNKKGFARKAFDMASANMFPVQDAWYRAALK